MVTMEKLDTWSQKPILTVGFVFSPCRHKCVLCTKCQPFLWATSVNARAGEELDLQCDQTLRDQACWHLYGLYGQFLHNSQTAQSQSQSQRSWQVKGKFDCIIPYPVREILSWHPQRLKLLFENKTWQSSLSTPLGLVLVSRASPIFLVRDTMNGGKDQEKESYAFAFENKLLCVQHSAREVSLRKWACLSNRMRRIRSTSGVFLGLWITQCHVKLDTHVHVRGFVSSTGMDWMRFLGGALDVWRM